MPKTSILVVDDEPNNFDVIETYLGHQDYVLHYVASGEEAVLYFDQLSPDLVLLDVMMPEMDGIQTCQQLKERSQSDTVPVIMVTALTDKQDLSQCLAAGADDFISKPVDRFELNARVRSMLRIRQQYQQLATFNTQLETKVQQRTNQLSRMIFWDDLTQLPSRKFFIQKLSESLLSEELSLAIVYLDCDRFNLVNGSLGYSVGNQLLVAITQRLKQCLKSEIVLSRVGEDEFCFLLSDIKNESQLEYFIRNLIKIFDAPFSLATGEIFMTICIGGALCQKANQNAEELLQAAETAMYQAKLKGKGNYAIFDHQMYVQVSNHLILENDLQHALENQAFLLHYQPIFHLKTQKLTGFEALVRWHHPTRGLIAPESFIAHMETTGLIMPVGIMLLKQACQQLSIWHQQGWTDITMSVNLSARQFSRSTLIADINQVLQETHLNPASLKLELTESTIAQNTDMAVALLKALRSQQIQISIDDFGTGYSSLSYLHKFPADHLKIDRSFINQIQSDDFSHHFVDMIIEIGQRIGLSIIAEGIETLEQLEWLKKQGCEFGQGFLFSEPLEADAIERRYFHP